jgi:hypothetical protein
MLQMQYRGENQRVVEVVASTECGRKHLRPFEAVVSTLTCAYHPTSIVLLDSKAMQFESAGQIALQRPEVVFHLDHTHKNTLIHVGISLHTCRVVLESDLCNSALGAGRHTCLHARMPNS